MSPIHTLLLALLALHVVEGVLWVRRSASAFVRGWSRRHRALDTVVGPYGDGESCLLLLSPWPPLSEITVTDPWPVVFGDEEVLLSDVERAPRARRVERVPRATAAEAAGATVEGKRVRAGALVAATSSPAAAHALAALLRRWGSAPPEARRTLVDEARAARFDRDALRARLEQVERSGRWLRVLSHVAPLALFGGVYAFFYVPGIDDRLSLGALVLLTLASWIELFRVHRRLHPELTGDRATKLFLMISSLPALARTRAWVARDGLAAFHPLAVAEALLPREAFERWAAPRWRDLRYPIAPEPPELAPAAQRERAALIEAYGRLFAACALDPATLEAPPAGADVYCPRCHAELRHPEGECPDCPGVLRVRSGAGPTPRAQNG